MKKTVQFCHKCKSTNIQVSKLGKFDDPIKIQGMIGWDCLDCGYTGKDFFIVDINEYKKMRMKE